MESLEFKTTCKDCIYFIQHYVKYARGYSTANCGHCKYPKIKPRTPYDAICKSFKRRDDT